MDTAGTDFKLVLSDTERSILFIVLEQAWLDAHPQVKVPETGYKVFIREHEESLRRLIDKVDHLRLPDQVELASEQSFPASDPPSWAPLRAGDARK